MRTTTKLLAPLAFALTTLSAHAGVFNLEYPLHDGNRISASSAPEASGAAVSVGVGLNLLHSESAPRDNPALRGTPPSRDQVLRELEQSPPDLFYDARYFQ